ncbi:uncharacterized protein LOC118754931 [Rhagoletis pomonella]|uniref:uncharacterized protein LOC118754931 n=1 Tax=Rhagoletis pomonella TaxID=28610 RepID=UPI00177B9868|nr:uncharacterized protein LOC118754931 [Rhagoletis pomonella]
MQLKLIFSPSSFTPAHHIQHFQLQYKINCAPNQIDEHAIQRFNQRHKLSTTQWNWNNGEIVVIVAMNPWWQTAGLGVYISRIEENSVAERAGLRPGDTILEVNGTPFTSINHEEALKMMFQNTYSKAADDEHML